MQALINLFGKQCGMNSPQCAAMIESSRGIAQQQHRPVEKREASERGDPETG
jgi:hypothetical protein